MSLTKRLDLNLTEIVILDTTQFEGPPVAVVRLPLALKSEIYRLAAYEPSFEELTGRACLGSWHPRQLG